LGDHRRNISHYEKRGLRNLYIEKDASPMMKIRSLEIDAYFLSDLTSAFAKADGRRGAVAMALEGRDLSRGTG
jgi:hypothetical protein